MYIRSLQLPTRRTLVVLGAGATRGASFVSRPERLYSPPLDNDFFRLLSSSPAGKSQQAKALLRYVQTNHSPTLRVSMESIFVELQGSAEFYEQFNVGRGRIVREPQRTIEHFYRVLPGMLRHSVVGACEYHRLLAAKLESGDAVISLNYDCLMDDALRDAGGRRWNPRFGYGFDAIDGVEVWRNWGSGANAGTPIRLLKLHGSLNWKFDGAQVSLIADPYERDSADGSIVPPLGRKPVSTEPFSGVWREARIRVRRAERLVVIGYSLPAADYLVRALLRADLDPSSLRELIVVDPSDEVADRFVQLLTQAPMRVESMRSFKEFAAWLEADGNS